ncbi:hypothetical protein BDA99DRAFT_501893 [Phascolomyces articulosus]|uniref:Uncharacterized protein n=1 Tax=Phascolomyces articulosus TaxID=60185 RepID=A0AAD5PGT9_9FUNG|nr:hypothetical protein BDA99DRAFT_501893 [Phascolomyces articulosus]
MFFLVYEPRFLVFPALPSIQQEFSTTETVTNAIIASNIVIGGIAPAIWAVYSDLHAFRNLHCCKIHAIDGYFSYT